MADNAPSVVRAELAFIAGLLAATLERDLLFTDVEPVMGDDGFVLPALRFSTSSRTGFDRRYTLTIAPSS